MDPDDISILNTVMDVVRRYGIKRTTMAEIAKGAGVSRQTLYDRFGDKDEIMAAAIDLWAGQLRAGLAQAVEAEPSLDAIIDAYYAIVVWPFFDALQAMPDAADLERGQGPASVAASLRARAAKQALLAEAFAPHLSADAPRPDAVATFFEEASTSAKTTAQSRDSLAQFLDVLRAATLALRTPAP